MIYLSKIEHRGTTRIQVKFEKKANLMVKIKSIKGRKWSQTKRCWHLPYLKNSITQLEAIFGKDQLVFPKKDKFTIVNKTFSKISYSSYQLGGETKYKITGEKIILQKKNQQWLRVYVPYHKKGWTEVIRNINGRKWNTEKVCWEIPNVKTSYWQMKKHIGMKNLQFDFVIQKDIPEEYNSPISIKKRKKTNSQKSYELLNQHQKNEITKMEEKIILQRLSISTLKSYRNHLIAIFHHFKNLTPTELTPRHIEKFLLHQIKNKKISESTQNQIINSYKAYAEKVLNRSPEWIDIQRPKKPKKLPNILSSNEVIALINSINNLKHKLCILLIYSAGLRRSELLNLKKKDVHIERRTLHIKGGKGKKDRYVTLAETVIPYLKKYIKEYHPIRWLFEGQHGGKYSASSLQKIFINALAESNINSYATLHTLRHSYATHCVENGHNLKSVQEALGHASLKTTEIYLHISSDALKKLISPLDNLDID